MAVNLKLLESDHFDQKKNRALKQTCCILQSVLHLLIWCDYNLQKNFNKHYRKLFLEKDIRDQNRHKHGDNLGSKVTNHKMTKLRGPRFFFCFVFSACSLVRFSSFRSGSNNLAALSTSFIHVFVTELVTSQLFWILSGSNNFFFVFNWNCWGLNN